MPDWCDDAESVAEVRSYRGQGACEAMHALALEWDPEIITHAGGLCIGKLQFTGDMSVMSLRRGVRKALVEPLPDRRNLVDQGRPRRPRSNE